MRILFFLLLVAPAFATNYYVTQSGAASPLSTSSGSPSSVATYNASALPTGGDTVFFSGTITSTVTPATSGTGNGASRLILDFSAATLNTATPRIACNGKNYITYAGGGSWSGGVYTPGCVFGAVATAQYCFDGNRQLHHDITISGFQCIASAVDSYNALIFGEFFANLLVTQNNLVNLSNLYYGDTADNHDITFSYNLFDQSTNVTNQDDIVQIGDGYNITFDGNKFIMRSPGDNGSGRHNDCIQTFRSGAGSSQNPYGWIVRYNWLELQCFQVGPLVSAGSFVTSGSGAQYKIVTPGTTNWVAIGAANNNVGTIFQATGVGSGTGTANAYSTGDNSWLMLEQMTDNGGTPAIKVYGNVFVGGSGIFANNGASCGGNIGGTYYNYNNTYITSAGQPGNTSFWGAGGGSLGSLYSRNNIGIDITSVHGGTPLSWTMTVGATWDYNWFYQWNSPSSTYYGTHGASNTNPLLNNSGSSQFWLQSGSPCKGAGDITLGAEFSSGIAVSATWPNPTLQARGSSWDIGAYQLSSGGGATFSSSLSGKVLLPGKVQIK